MSSTKPRILIVDNNEMLRNKIAGSTQAEHFEVVEALSGNQLIAQLYDHIDLIIVDLQMPNLDAIEFVKTVRQRVPRIAIITLTVAETTDKAIESLRLGAIDYLVKPIILNELTVKIKRALEQQALTSEIADLHVQLKEKEEINQKLKQMVDVTAPDSSGNKFASSPSPVAPGMSLQEMELEAIRRTLQIKKGRRKQTAEVLGISVRTLQRKIKEYNLEPSNGASPATTNGASPAMTPS